MYSNFYIRYNYKNIIPFNLKKNKLRVHANIIGSKTTNLYGFFIGGEVKFWYYHFGINGLKRDNIFLVKKFLNKKLGVFFISNFNMVEGKWLFPKIYEQYYKNNLFLKKKKMNLFKNRIININNYSIMNNNYFIKFLNNINIYNTFKLNYLYNINLILNLHFINSKFNNLYKFRKLLNSPLLYSNNNNNINCTNIYMFNIQERFNKLKKFYWNWNFYLKCKLLKKKKVDILWIRQKPIWFFQKKNWYFDQQSNIFFKKKWAFIKNKNYLNNFYFKKNIINFVQFIKMNKAIYKINKKNIVFLFYIFYLHFSFIKLYKNAIKNKNKKWAYYKINKLKNLIKKNIYPSKYAYNIININLKKKSFNWTKLIFYKNLNKGYNKKFYIKFFINLKKKIKKYYKFKLYNKNYIMKNLNNKILINNITIYSHLYKIWLKYNKLKKKKKLIKLYFLKKKYSKKYIKKYTNKNIYLLWLHYIIKRQSKLV